MIPENGKAKFIKLYPGAFAEYVYPQFQNSQEFTLDGGVFFDILAMECSFQHFSIQYEFGF